MATVWAKNANTYWSNVSNYATFNETTQQIEDYGQLPQLDDIFYFNGRNIYLDIDNVIVKELHSDLNPYTQIQGGSFGILTITPGSSVKTITGNVFGVVTSQFLSLARSGMNWTFNGNVSNVFFNANVNNITININGNCNNCIFRKAGTQLHTININGVCSVTENYLTTQQPYDVTAYKLIASHPIQNNNSINLFKVIGEFIPYGDLRCNFDLNLDGYLNLTESTANKPNEIVTSGYYLGLGANATFTEKTDYPQPEDVRKNVSYDFGRKVGEMEQVINNTNTINVYPYKKRQ